MTVLAHQADFRGLTLLSELLGGIHCEQNRLSLAQIGAEFLAMEADDPVVVILDDEIP
jgi:hypothetical protein